MQTTRRWCGWALSVLAGTAVAGDSIWTSTGPLGGGVFELAFHPSDPLTAYATTRGAVFKTVDGGATWVRASRGIIATSVYPLPLVLDRDAPNTLYTSDSSQRIYRSSDGAASWQIVENDLDPDFLFEVLSDVAGSSNKLFVGGRSQVVTGLPQLFKSNNRGANFIRVGAGLPADRSIATITVDPLNANTVYVGTYGASLNEASLFRSNDGGNNFVPILNLFGTLGYQPDVQDLSFIPGTGTSGSIFAVIDYNIFHSADGGANWTGPHGPAEVITAHPTDPLKAYFGRADGAFVWTAPNPSPSFFPYSEGLTPNASYVAIPGGAPVPAEVSRLVAQPGYPAPGTSLFVSTNGSGVFRRAEGAGVWSASGNPAGAGIRALAIQPHPALANANGSPQVLAGHSGAGAPSPGLYRSTDQALSWNAYNNGVRAGELQSLVIDPTTLGGNISATVMYAGGAAVRSDTAYSGAGLLRSSNNGASWQTIDGDLPVDENAHPYIGLVRELVLDPRSCPVPPVSGPCTTGGLQTLYALAEGRAFAIVRRSDPPVPTGSGNPYEFSHRLVRTSNLGASWTALDGTGSGLPTSFGNDDLAQRITPTSLAFDPNNSNLLYLGTEAIYDDFNTGDAIVPADFASGIFRSSNAGATWTHLASNGLPTKVGFSNTQLDVAALLIDPLDGNVLWAALTDLRNTGFSTIYRSADAGATWLPHNEGLNGSVELRDLVFDPQNHHILYAAAGGYEANPGAIYRGVWDPGTQSITWLSISIGLPAESAYSVAVDPFNANVLHAGTDAGVASILRQPDTDNDGIPDAVENLAPDVPGGIAGPGDGNGDGVLDAVQRDVGSIGVSIRRAEGSAAVAVTSDLISGTGSAACINGTAQAVDVQLLEPIALGRDPVAGSSALYAHSYGTNGFELVGCNTAVINIRYHGASFTPGSLWTFRVFAPLVAGDAASIQWHDFSGNASRISNDTWQVQLSAGEFGSYRPDLNAIRFVGGPACYNPLLFADGLESTPPAAPICPE